MEAVCKHCFEYLSCNVEELEIADVTSSVKVNIEFSDA